MIRPNLHSFVVLLLSTIVVGVAGTRAEGPLTSLAQEVLSKGSPAEDFNKFALTLGVPGDDGSLRHIRAKHYSRLRMVWSRPVPGTETYDVFFADFTPELGLLFLTDDYGTLRRAFRLTQDIPPLEMLGESARPEFERERDFWLRWAR